jgi:hypothetical protein
MLFQFRSEAECCEVHGEKGSTGRNILYAYLAAYLSNPPQLFIAICQLVCLMCMDHHANADLEVLVEKAKKMVN